MSQPSELEGCANSPKMARPFQPDRKKRNGPTLQLGQSHLCREGWQQPARLSPGGERDWLRGSSAPTGQSDSRVTMMGPSRAQLPSATTSQHNPPAAQTQSWGGVPGMSDIAGVWLMGCWEMQSPGTSLPAHVAAASTVLVPVPEGRAARCPFPSTGQKVQIL